MNADLKVLSETFLSVFNLMQVEYNLFGFDISLMDILIANAVIYMLLDLIFTYAGYERNE